MRYGRILFNFEIWRFFTCVLTVGYPSWYMYLCVMIVFVHLRTFEAHPVLLTQTSNVFCNFLVCFFYAVLCFWVVCLFYPLYYGGGFIIIVLLTIEALRDREETTNVIGFRLPRRYFPFFYAFVTLMIGGSVVCVLFAIGCGVLYLYLTKDNSKGKAIFVNALHRLQYLLGYSDVTILSREELRTKMKERYAE
ncbi:hypothetical protein WA171_001395 [Blastocystis sp. BT1]